MNNGHSTGYFALKRGSRQGDPLSGLLILLTIKVLFITIRKNVNIKGLNIFENEIKLTACAGDTTHFLNCYVFFKSLKAGLPLNLIWVSQNYVE